MTLLGRTEFHEKRVTLHCFIHRDPLLNHKGKQESDKMRFPLSSFFSF